MNKLIFNRNSMPDNPLFGWPDYVEYYREGRLVYGSHCSTCPNPYKVNNDKFIPWQLAYGCVAEGNYYFECIGDHHKFGKCLIVNEGDKVPTINRDTSTQDFYAIGIFIHEGALKSDRRDWRGSAGCFTLPPDRWPEFISHFETNETGVMVLQKLITNISEIQNEVSGMQL